MVAEFLPADLEDAEEIADPVDEYPEQFRKQLRKSREGIIAAANDLDPTAAIAHARALRSALYRAEGFSPSSGW